MRIKEAREISKTSKEQGWCPFCGSMLEYYGRSDKPYVIENSQADEGYSVIQDVRCPECDAWGVYRFKLVYTNTQMWGHSGR